MRRAAAAALLLTVAAAAAAAEQQQHRLRTPFRRRGHGAAARALDCEAALEAACAPQRRNPIDCAACAGGHAAQLQQAGCSNERISHWCAGLAPIVSRVANNRECGYVASVSVGTPPQQLDLLMDTGSANVFFGGTGCADPRLGPCTKPLYSASDSRTFNASGKFAMFQWCTGQLGADAVTLSPGAVIKAQSFGLCSASSILQPPTKGGSWYSGIFGLGMRALEQQHAQIIPPLTLLKQQGLIVSLHTHSPPQLDDQGSFSERLLAFTVEGDLRGQPRSRRRVRRR